MWRRNKDYKLNANGLMTSNINKSKPSSRVQLDHVRSFCGTVGSIFGSMEFLKTVISNVLNVASSR